jgi:hypothetical protein
VIGTGCLIARKRFLKHNSVCFASCLSEMGGRTEKETGGDVIRASRAQTACVQSGAMRRDPHRAIGKKNRRPRRAAAKNSVNAELETRGEWWNYPPENVTEIGPV